MNLIIPGLAQIQQWCFERHLISASADDVRTVYPGITSREVSRESRGAKAKPLHP
jgi:hypothetical protein